VTARKDGTKGWQLLTVKFNKSEYEAVRADAAAFGMNMSDYVRRAVKAMAVRGPDFDDAPKPAQPPPPEPARAVIAEAFTPGHRHVAASIVGGGIALCSCGARRAGAGPWTTPR
jgi:hypothetical protein